MNNYAPDTVRFYERSIYNFSLFHSLDSPISDLDEDLIEEYTLYLREKNICSMSIHTYLSGMRRIIHYFAQKGYILNFNIVMPKVETPIKEVYTEEELKKLLKKPNVKTCRFVQYRDWVMVNYLLGTGQRRNTVAHLKVGDLDLMNRLVKLRVVKNKKPVILPLTNSLALILEEYLSYRGGTAEDPLFCSREGKPLSSESLSNAIRRYNLSRGVDRTSVHIFRHTFAYLSIKNNMDIVRLQRLLCHSDIKTTQGYLRSFGFEELQEDYERFNPLETFIGQSEVMKNWNKQQGKRK